MAVTAPFQVARVVRADQYDDRINAIQKEIDDYQAKAGLLQGQADSLQKEVAALTTQKNVIQGQIDLKQAEHDKLVAQIKASEDKIVRNQDVLGDTIANIYIDGKNCLLRQLCICIKYKFFLFFN